MKLDISISALAEQRVRIAGVLVGSVQQRKLQCDGVRQVADRVDVREVDEDFRGEEEQPVSVPAPQTVSFVERGSNQAVSFNTRLGTNIPKTRTHKNYFQ